MKTLLLQVKDSLEVAEGHKDIADQINILTVLITSITIVGLVIIIRYIVKERFGKKK